MRIPGMYGYAKCSRGGALTSPSQAHKVEREPKLKSARETSRLETPESTSARAHCTARNFSRRTTRRISRHASRRTPLRFAPRRTSCRADSTTNRQRATHTSWHTTPCASQSTTRTSTNRQHGIIKSAQKALRVGLSVLLACSLTFTLSSCRESDTLVEKIIGQPYEYETDDSLSPVSVDNPDEAATNLTSQHEDDDVEREDEWTESQPEYSEEEDQDSEEAPSPLESDLPASDAPAIEGDSSGDDESDQNDDPNNSGGTSTSASSEDGDGNEGGGTTIVVSSSGSSNDPQPDEGESEDDDTDSQGGSTWNPSSSSSDSDSGSGRTTGSTYSEGDLTSGRLPSVGSIAAAGPYATIVQAIGGTGALAACDSDWYNSLADEAFNYKSELSDTTVISAWDGGASMNEATFQAIVASGAEAVITSASYGGIDQDWAERFNEAGISVIEFPVIGVTDATDDDIVTCVEAVGVMLADAENIGQDAASMASAWVSLHDEALTNVVNANGGYTTYLMEGSTSDVLFDGIGRLFGSTVATHITRTSSNRFYTTVVNSWTESSEGIVTGSSSLNSYPFGRIMYGQLNDIWPFGVRDGNWGYAYGSVREDHNYFSLDMSDGFAKAITSSGTGGNEHFVLSDYYLQHAGVIDTLVSYHSSAYTSAYIDRTSSALFLLRGQSTLWIFLTSFYTNPVVVGDEQYPGLIVRNDDVIIESIRASAAKADRSTWTIGVYNLGQTYYLYVVPDGADGKSWLDGTFESFLMAPWAYCCFQQGGDLSACTSYLNEFYETFYRCGSDVAGENGYGQIVEVECNLG